MGRHNKRKKTRAVLPWPAGLLHIKTGTSVKICVKVILKEANETLSFLKPEKGSC